VDKVYAGAYTDLENFPFRQRDDASAYITDRLRIAELPYQMRVNVISVKPESGAFREADGYPDAGMTEFPAISAVSG